jgi:hypothetical protein
VSKARGGPAVGVYTVRMGSDVGEAQIDGLSDAEIDVLLEIYEVLPGNDPSEMTFHEESGAPRSQDSVTGGAGGSAVSHASSALISEPEFFLDLGKDRLLVNSSPQPSDPACRARSMIGRKSFTFSVSSHRCCVLAHANISSSDFERRSGRSATAITSWPPLLNSAAIAGENISSSRSPTSGRWFTR